MSNWKVTLRAAVFCLSVAIAGAQNVPFKQATLQLSAYDARSAQVPAGSATTLLAFTLETDQTGDNKFHVITSDPNVLVSLILPSGVEINAGNATSLGFTFQAISADDIAAEDVPSPLSLPGYHTVIQVPASQPSGAAAVTSAERSRHDQYPPPRPARCQRIARAVADRAR